jgi:hypothetical protein
MVINHKVKKSELPDKLNNFELFKELKIIKEPKTCIS